MSFEEFLNQAWGDHASQAEQVALRFPSAISLISSDAQIAQFAQLATHVYGEHLGQWEQGLDLLQQLRGHSAFNSQSDTTKVLDRQVASLELASGKRDSVNDFSISDRVRILALAASALCGQQQIEKAHSFFSAALEQAQQLTEDSAPAKRSLAITSNNLACSLEEKPSRTKADMNLMIQAAHAGRKYWEMVGSWLEVERAEYRLAQSYLKADLIEGAVGHALKHAQNCLELVRHNHAPPLEYFFAYEALALVERARGNHSGYRDALTEMKAQFDQLSPEDKQWCESSLEKVLVSENYCWKDQVRE